MLEAFYPASYTHSALSGIEQQLKPASKELLMAIAQQMLTRSNCRQIESNDIACILSPYPEDLLCASYYRAIQHTWQSMHAMLSYMMEFMEPEFAFRKQRYIGILQLHS